MTNLITVALLATNILATNRLEFRTNVSVFSHPTNRLFIYMEGTNTSLVPFVEVRKTNIVRWETLEAVHNGRHTFLESKQATIMETQAVFELNPCNWKWERK